MMAQAKTLSKAELKRVLDVTKACSKYAERDCVMLLLTHWCGMRIGEVAALRVEDVLEGSGTVKAEFTLDARRTKSKKARAVYVPARMQKELQRYTQHTLNGVHSGFLFTTQKSQRFSANTATQLLQRLYARAGIADATSHSGRRTFITEGTSVRVLAELAGHQSIATTQRYIDIQPHMLRNAVELI
jgi:integrase/recombinase XerD